MKLEHYQAGLRGCKTIEEFNQLSKRWDREMRFERACIRSAIAFVVIIPVLFGALIVYSTAIN